MSKDVGTFYETWKADRQKIKAHIPALSGAYSTFYQTVMKDGALSMREKELIAMAIGVADCCDPCIRLHVRGCLKAGATPEQVLEAAEVAVIMQGGPAFTHLPEVLNSLEYLQTTSHP